MKSDARRQDTLRADARALAQVQQLIEDGEYDAASVLGWQVQRSAPGDPKVWLLLARIDQVRGQHPAAMYAARMATRLQPDWVDGWICLAEASLTRGRWHAEGLDAAVQATTIAPDDPRAWTVLSRVHLAGQAYYEAAVAAERAISLDPGNPATHRAHGEVALAAGEWRHAVNALNRALELDPTDAVARAALEEARQAQGGESLAQLRRDEMTNPAASDAAVPRRRRRSRLPDRGPRAKRDQRLRARSPVSPLRAGLLPWPTRSILAVALLGALLGMVGGLALPDVGVLRAWAAIIAAGLAWVAAQPGPYRARPKPAPADDDDVVVRVFDAQADRADSTESLGRGRDPAGQRAPSRPPAAAPEPAADAPPPSDQVAGNGAGPAPQPRDTRPSARAEAQLPNDDRLPSDPDELATLSRAYLAELDLDAARNVAERLSVVSPDSVEAHRALAAVALAAQDYELAEWHYGQVLEREPLDQEANERLLMAQAGRSRGQARGRRRGRP